MSRFITRFLLSILDLICINVALLAALLLRFDGLIDTHYLEVYEESFLLISAIMLLCFYIFNMYKSVWRYASMGEMLQVVVSCFSGSIMMYLAGMLQGKMFPKGVYVIFVLEITFLMIISRFSYRFIKGLRKGPMKHMRYIRPITTHKKKKPVLIVGAGEAASIFIKDYNSLQSKKAIVVAVDDDEQKINSCIHGIRIKGNIDNIPEIALAYEIEEIIIAMPSASKKRISEILEICSQTDCELKIFPGIQNSIEGRNHSYIRPVKIEDLLGRDEIVHNNEEIANIIKDKIVLVTGGGGSIGSELCRQIIEFDPKKLIIFDIYENTTYELFKELLQSGVSKEKLEVIIGSIRDIKKLGQVFQTYQPQIVFHAAAHKHVSLMEYSPEEAIKNNVFGTLNVALMAREYKAKKMILVSTDKAVNPTNVMGTTKRICEMIIQSINATTKDTDYVAVRFGNVLGSHGSVIPLFKKQLEMGGPITVTHPDIIRYFMTIPEAVNLILQATSFATGGEIFVLDMGKPVKILDLAKNFIRLSGLEIGKDIELKIIGLRPGEKLYEELLLAEEGLTDTKNNKIYVAKPGDTVFEDLLEQIAELKEAVEYHKDIRKVLKKIVPNFTYNQEKDKDNNKIEEKSIV